MAGGGGLLTAVVTAADEAETSPWGGHSSGLMEGRLHLYTPASRDEAIKKNKDEKSVKKKKKKKRPWAWNFPLPPVTITDDFPPADVEE